MGLLWISASKEKKRTVAAAQQSLATHFQAIDAGDTNAALAQYAPRFFTSRETPEQLAHSLAQLHAKGLSDYTIVDHEVISHTNGVIVRFDCRSQYGSTFFNEEFDFFRATGSTNFVIIRHDFD